MNKKKRVQLTLIFVISSAIILAFQNCSVPMDVAKTTAASMAAPNSGAPENPPHSCPDGMTWDGSSCVPQSIDCKKYVELPATENLTNIPARDGSQTCYFMHLIDAVALGHALPSSTWKTSRNDIVARSHDTSHANAAPRIIGTVALDGGGTAVGAVKKIRINLEGTRKVMLGGNSAGNIPMSVDNFILLEMNSATRGIQYLGEGTQDAVPWLHPENYNDKSVTSITINNVAVPYVSFGQGGTTQITPVDISDAMPINDPMDLRVTGLDCGGVGDISDIFIMFQ